MKYSDGTTEGGLSGFWQAAWEIFKANIKNEASHRGNDFKFWLNTQLNKDPLEAFANQHNLDVYNSADTSPDSSGIGSINMDDLTKTIGQLRYNLSGNAAQNEFNREMDATKTQRLVADLEAAGLNPMAAAGAAGVGSVSSSNGAASTNIIPGLLNGIAHIVSSSIHAASQDNRTLTMANSASSINTAKIAADAARKAAMVEYFQNKAHKPNAVFNNTANYFSDSKKSSDNKPPYESKNKQWVDDYWKNFK